MKILIVSGSRADWGLLEWPIKVLQEDSFFEGEVMKIHGYSFQDAFSAVWDYLQKSRPDTMLVLGDRFEILAAATAAHLLRVPIAHIAGGDITEGSYDDAMRDCISRMGSIHFTTSNEAQARLVARGYRNVHMTGSPGVDYILKAPWRGDRPIEEPYVVVSYQAETINAENEFLGLPERLGIPKNKHVVFLLPNLDRGSDKIKADIANFENATVYESVDHPKFLNLLAHCEEFIGNSSAMLYEAPFLGVKTRMIGKRQRGRVIPFGDGNASERIRDALKAWIP